METSNDVRRRALTGGFVLLGGALLLLGLAGVFVVDRTEPEEVFGVYTPLAIAVLVLEFSLFAFVPALWGDSVETATPTALRAALLSVGVLGLAASAASATLGDGWWALGALLPGACSLVPIRDGFVLHDKLVAMRGTQTASSSGSSAR